MVTDPQRIRKTDKGIPMCAPYTLTNPFMIRKPFVKQKKPAAGELGASSAKEVGRKNGLKPKPIRENVMNWKRKRFLEELIAEGDKSQISSRCHFEPSMTQ